MKKIFIAILLSVLFGSSFAQALSKPVLLQPTNNWTNGMPHQRFLWNALASLEPVTYILELSDNVDMNNVTSYESLMLPEIYVSDLVYGSTYFWRVKAKTASATSVYSDVFSFKVISTISLSEPAISNPRTLNVNVTISNSYPNASNVLSGTDGFEFYFGEDPTYADMSMTSHEVMGIGDAHKLYDDKGKLISYRLATFNGLTYNTTYYCKVRCFTYLKDNVSDKMYSDWLEREITVAIKPTLDKPYYDKDDDIINQEPYDMVSNFKWKNITGTSEYVFEISEDINFVNKTTVQVVTTSEVKPKNIGFGKVYYWRVKAVSATSESLYSDVWAFRTLVQKPVVILPVNETVQNTNPVYFVGNKILGAEGYVLEFYDPKDTSTPKKIIERTVYRDPGDSLSNLQKTFTITKYLEFDREIEWTIKGFVRSDTTTKSDPRTVMVNFTSPSLVFPANNMSVNNLVNVKWETLLGATGYEIEYASDVAFTQGVNLITISDPMKVNIEILFPAGQDFYIRMRAKAGDKYSEYCEIRKFHAGISQPVILSPLHPYEGNPMLVVSPVTFTWSPIYGLSDYVIEYSKDIEFEDTNTIRVEYAHGLEIDQLRDIVIPEGVYYWRVKGVVWKFDENGDIVVNGDGVRETVDESMYSLVGNFKVVGALGVDDFEADLLSIYPNPCKNNLTVDNINLDGKTGIFITDITGKKLLVHSVDDVYSNGKLEINVSSLRSGIYFLTVEGDKQILTRKFVKE